MSNKIATPYDFGKYKIILTNHSGKRIDISNLVVELNFFESLSLPYVTGSLMVVDSANVFNATNFMGQEELDISVTDINGALKIKKSFVVSSLRRQEKTQDSTSAYVVTFTERHVYVSKMKRFSKAYVGKPESILSDVLQEHLGVTVRAEGSSQSEIRYLTPFTQSALSIANMMRSRCTTGSGLPFFLHSSLYTQDELNLVSLQTLLGQGPFNPKPFTYASATLSTGTGGYTTEDFNSLTYKVASMDLPENQEVLDILAKAGYGTQYLWVDNIDQIPMEDRMKIIEPLGASPKPNGKMDYDPGNSIGGMPLHESVSKYITQITTAKLFEDVLSFNEETDMTNHLRKGKSKGMRSFSVKGTATFQCPGFAFLGKDIMGKSQIDVFVPKDQPIDMHVGKDFVKDKKRSGKYVVAGTRHMFKNSQYTVVVSGVKIDNIGSIDSEDFYRGEPSL